MVRAIRNLLRLFGVGWTLARFGALFPLEQLHHAPALGVLARLSLVVRRRDHGRLRPGERLAAALVALGPSFIKFGQSLATRSDLIGDDISRDLSRLQDKLPPFSHALAKATVEDELEASLADSFLSFDETPVAAASIAQVHYAVTPDGAEVAVKVLRPGIEASFARDIDLFRWIAGVMETHLPWVRRLRPVEVVELFAETVQGEMDMRMEAAAAAELAENFVDDPDFKVPRVDWQRTTRRVLTLERLRGHRPDDLEALRAEGHDPTEILRKSACIFFNQVFRDGYFHADMHPGNVFILEDGRVAPVDFGIMGRLDVKTRHFLADMLIGFLTGDYKRVSEVHFRAGYVPAHKSVDAFAQACRSIGEPILGRPLSEISLANLLARLFRVTEQFEMQTQPQLLLLQKTMLVAEGVGRQVNDQVNIWELARPLIEQWMIENRSPQARVRQAAVDALAFAERLPALTERAERAINDLADGGLRLHPDTVRQFAEVNRGRRTFGWSILLVVLVAALVVAVGAD
jgi:ubiquinone biosynthesis protein